MVSRPPGGVVSAPPATTWATTPQPKRMRIMVPANSADSSPINPDLLNRSLMEARFPPAQDRPSTARVRMASG